jgi:splicing factor 45
VPLTNMASEQSQKAQALPNPYGIPKPYPQKGLPNPYAAATISAAPVKYTEEQAKAAAQKRTSGIYLERSLRFP